MKRLFFVLLCVLMSCSQGGSDTTSRWEESVKLKVLATTAMIGDLVQAVGGERVSTLVLIKGEIDPHSYELVKGDDEKISRAAVVFYNGLGLEHGASLRYLIKQHPHALAVGEAVMALHPEVMIWDQGQLDPHIWMDISIWSMTVTPIIDALCEADPEGAEVFKANGEKLLQQMGLAHKNVFTKLQAIAAEKRFLVTSHDAFNYFARGYLATQKERDAGEWKERFASPEGLSPDGQLSAADIQHIVEHLLKFKISTVFPESNVSQDSLKKIIQVCQRKGVAVTLGPAIYGDAMGKERYLSMIEYDAEVLTKAWGL